MEVAGHHTGAIMAVAEVGGRRAVQIRPLLRAATRVRGHSAPAFLRVGAPITYNADSVRATSGRRRSFRVATFVNEPTFARSASMISTDGLRVTPRRRSFRAPNEPICLRSTSTLSTDGIHTAARRPYVRASEGTKKTPAETDPEATSGFWGKVANMLSSKIFKLMLLGASFAIGCLAVKNYSIAETAVDICDKTHKVYNMMSKALVVLIALLKGDE